MSTEIKINFADAKTALSELNTVAAQFESILSSQKDEENNLEMVHTLNELKDSFDELTRAYQQLLLKTTDAALHAVDTMKETDETLAQAMGS